MRTETKSRLHTASLTAFLFVIVGIVFTCWVTSSRWINTTFPGFVALSNGVVASVSLPHWPVAHHPSMYQQAVVAVNGQAVVTAEELYALVRAFPPGAPMTYTLKKGDQFSTVTFPSQTFALKDYCLLFGAYWVNGLAFACLALGVWRSTSTAPVGCALRATGLSAGLFALTALDLYSPSWFFRLHVLGEAFLPAGLVHLALVFPIDRLRRRRSLFVALPYGLSIVLGLLYECFLYRPTAYSLIHNACMVYAGLAGFTLIGGLMVGYWETVSGEVRRKIRSIVFGGVAGYAFPALLVSISGVTGGSVAVNYAAFTAFLFPLLGYALAQHNLHQVEGALRRGVAFLSLLFFGILR